MSPRNFIKRILFEGKVERKKKACSSFKEGSMYIHRKIISAQLPARFRWLSITPDSEENQPTRAPVAAERTQAPCSIAGPNSLSFQLLRCRPGLFTTADIVISRSQPRGATLKVFA